MKQEKFYVLSSNQSPKYKYLKKLVEGSFDKRKICKICGNNVEYDEEVYKNLEFEISDNSEFPDNIMYGGAPNFLFISEKALQAFIKEEITGFSAYPINIYEGKEKLEIQYYILKIYGKAIYNYKKMGKKPAVYCENCGYTSFIGKRPLNYQFTYLKNDSWDGSDLFLNKLCTNKVVDVIKKYSLTGFDIQDIIHSLNPYNTDVIHL